MADDRVVHPPDGVSIMNVEGLIFVGNGWRPHTPADSIRLALAIIDKAVRADPTLTGTVDMEFIARMHKCHGEDEAIAEIVCIARDAFGEGPQEIP